MTEEDEEFQRLEREAKMRALEDDDTQVYKKPWVGLTEEERLECMGLDAVRLPLGWREVVGRVEAKLREKNA